MSATPAGNAVLFDRTETEAPITITVDSPAFADGGPVPDRFADYGGKVSPALEWSGVPAGTKSIALVVEDPDAPPPRTPYVHWVLYNVPPTVTRLPENVPKGERLNDPSGALQGKNDAGSTGYFGPRPPPGGPHHYHFQVFALDRALALGPGATRHDLAAAMRGRVLAKGRLVGTYQKK